MREEHATDGFEMSVAGGLYALLLCILGLLARGWGHGPYDGTNLPIFIFTAPLGVLLRPLGLVGLLACLAWWPVVGFVLGAARGPTLPAALLTLHAAIALSIFLLGAPFESADDYREAALQNSTVIFAGWIVYVIGQAAAWALVLVRWRAPGDTVGG